VIKGKLNISEFCSVRRGVPFMIISALLTSSGNASNALINDSKLRSFIGFYMRQNKRDMVQQGIQYELQQLNLKRYSY
jgi:hypothetical protein